MILHKPWLYLTDKERQDLLAEMENEQVEDSHPFLAIGAVILSWCLIFAVFCVVKYLEARP